MLMTTVQTHRSNIPTWFIILIIAQMVAIIALAAITAKREMDFGAGGTHLTVGASSEEHGHDPAPTGGAQEIPPVVRPD
jgi:hypothetical protein